MSLRCHNVAADESAHGASWTCGTFVALALPGPLFSNRTRQRFEQSLLLMSTPGAASLPTGLLIRIDIKVSGSII
jgi:hypothetical protein